MIDFRAGTATCLGTFPYWTAITDGAVGYGWLEDDRPARFDLAAGAEGKTLLQPGTLVPLGIAEGGYGVFAADGEACSRVVVLPAR